MIAEAILNRTPATPVRLNPDLPPKLEEVINKALEKDRKLRYQNAADIRTDLQRLKRDSDSGRAADTTTPVELKPTAKTTRFRWTAGHHVSGRTTQNIDLDKKARKTSEISSPAISTATTLASGWIAMLHEDAQKHPFVGKTFCEFLACEFRHL